MKEPVGTTGLQFNEPLLWEKGKKGRIGFSLPRRDVKTHPIDKNLKGDGPDFPELSEVDIVRHYIRLSQWNFSVDSGMYPLGSCTMKYNPKTNERQSARAGFARAHPLLPHRPAARKTPGLNHPRLLPVGISSLALSGVHRRSWYRQLLHEVCQEGGTCR